MTALERMRTKAKLRNGSRSETELPFEKKDCIKLSRREGMGVVLIAVPNAQLVAGFYPLGVRSIKVWTD